MGESHGMRTSSDLVAHVAASTGLSPGEATRVVAEVVGYFAEPVQDFVRRRHRELRRRGLHNEQSSRWSPMSWRTRVSRRPGLTARQLRRMIYG